MEYLTLNNGTRMPLVGFGTFSSISAPLPIIPPVPKKPKRRCFCSAASAISDFPI